MNYSRRPNRPDGNVYRDMRRRGMRRSASDALPINPKVLLVSVAVGVVVLLVWLVWK
jgi:hypothetical protein